jgi:Uma2 family endonuclease
MQMAVAGHFYVRGREWKIHVVPEHRVQVSASRFPDVCVVSRDREVEQILTRPPLICIEVLSKDDTLRSMQDRVDDDVAFGVPNIWVLNPVKRRAHVCSFRDFREPENGILEVANSPIGISLADLFADLD